MNKFLIVSLLGLSSCAMMDMQGTDTQDYYAQHPIENKVGPNGELISPPNCPDWSASPVTNYSNAKQRNIGCSVVTNLGLMLEEPRDLEKGASGGHVTPSPDRSADAIKNYRTGLANPSSDAGAAADSASDLAGAAASIGQ